MYSGKNQQIREEKRKVKPVLVNTENAAENHVDPDDPCKKSQETHVKKEKSNAIRTVGEDPRFQQQNQTLRCYVSYTDFFRCQKILGEGHEACDWFKDVYQTFCPLRWIEEWDQAREEGRMPYHKRNQGKFPGDKYGY